MEKEGWGVPAAHHPPAAARRLSPAADVTYDNNANPNFTVLEVEVRKRGTSGTIAVYVASGEGSRFMGRAMLVEPPGLRSPLAAGGTRHQAALAGY